MKIKVINSKEILDKLEKLAGFTPERAEKNKGWKVWAGKEAPGRFQKQNWGWVAGLSRVESERGERFRCSDLVFRILRKTSCPQTSPLCL